ncbi:MAG TPA: trans-aconitate 2-methyltransferase [Steroidobacteraceae bacterium]|nr:trans-aconitate 2-methyltransferase [Steroidobacteraceae bacterium]
MAKSSGFAKDTWSAGQYVLFERERTRPVHDLLAAVPLGAPRRAVDLGCGPGNSTELLARRYPGADVLGLDSSPDMVAAARRRLPHVRFEVRDLREWVRDGSSADVDLILSNAVLQWVPDHAALLPALLERLAPAGALAVQIPDNLAEPAQVLMREVAAAGPWARKLATAEAARVPIASPDEYYRLLAAHGAAVDLWRSTYYHVLHGEQAVVEWFKATGLRPFLDPLDEDERRQFLALYAERVRSAHPPLADGTVLLPFPRLFFVAQRRPA